MSHEKQAFSFTSYHLAFLFKYRLVPPVRWHTAVFYRQRARTRICSEIFPRHHSWCKRDVKSSGTGINIKVASTQMEFADERQTFAEWRSTCFLRSPLWSVVLAAEVTSKSPLDAKKKRNPTHWGHLKWPGFIALFCPARAPKQTGSLHVLSGLSCSSAESQVPTWADKHATGIVGSEQVLWTISDDEWEECLQVVLLCCFDSMSIRWQGNCFSRFH